MQRCGIFSLSPTIIESWFSGIWRSIWKVTTIGDIPFFHWTMIIAGRVVLHPKFGLKFHASCQMTTFVLNKSYCKTLGPKAYFSSAIITLTSWPWLSMLVYRGWPTTPGYIGSVTSHHEDPYKTNQDSMEGHKGFECCSYCAEGSSTHQFGGTKKSQQDVLNFFGGSTNGSPREVSAMISPHFLGKYSTLLLLFCNMRVDFVRFYTRWL